MVLGDQVLGQGSYGKVIMREGKAIKEFSRLSHLIQEYIALKYLSDCHYIVHSTGVNFKKLELEMELYDTSLRKWIEKRKGVIDKADVFKIVHDILMGLVELHDRNLVHGDLKPGNILIQEKPLRAVLGDCGFVSISKYAKVERTAASYREPEINHDYNHDMFSLGICYLELIGGVKISRQETYTKLREIVYQKVEDYGHKKIIYNLLHEDKRRRPTARELLLRLYNESPPLWENRIKEHSHVFHLSKQDIHYVRDKVVQVTFQTGLARGKRGYSALLKYLDVHHLSWNPIYFSATLAITSALFGGTNFRNQDLLYHGETENIEVIYQAIKEMIDNTSYVYILLSP